MKNCSRCKIEKPFSEFAKRKESKDGFRGVCYECQNKRGRELRDLNPEKYKQYHNQYRLDNREKKLEYFKQYRKDNKEYFLQYEADYRIKNKEKIDEYRKNWQASEHGKGVMRKCGREWKRTEKGRQNQRYHRHKRRALDANAMGFMPKDFKEKLINFYGKNCMNPACQKEITEINMITVDHVIPIALGGFHDMNNMQLLCRSCNASKSNRSEDDYRSEIYYEEF